MIKDAFWKTVWTFGVICAVLAALFFLLVGSARGAPIAEVSADGIRVVLTDEPCTITAVANLKRKATWTEHGKTLIGCWGAGNGMVLMYFESDKSVVGIPTQAFQKVTSV